SFSSRLPRQTAPSAIHVSRSIPRMPIAWEFMSGAALAGFWEANGSPRKYWGGGRGADPRFFFQAPLANVGPGRGELGPGDRGPNLACATACTTGAHAIGEAFRVIQAGDADAMICGGAEAVISPLAVAGFAAMRALSTRNEAPEQASRPWDRERDGFVVG